MHAVDPPWRGSGGVSEVFAQHAKARPQVPALQTAAGCLSYGDLHRQAVRLARALLVRGLQGRTPVAIWLPRGPDWLVCTVAVALVGVPFVWMSAEPAGGDREPGPQGAFNAEVLRVFAPQLVIHTEARGLQDLLTPPPPDGGAAASSSPPPSPGSASPATTTVTLELLLEGPKEDEEPPCKRICRDEAIHISADDLLCWFATGGSVSRKWVAVPHRMVLHEVEHYPALATLDETDRVLQNSGVMWGAAALGQLDIALAFGCTAVVVDASLPSDVADAVQRLRITCAGVVPSVLAALQPEELCPPVRVLFTWGEALPEEVALQWTRGPARLLDLLISTEYWLCLHADRRRPGPARFQPLPGVRHRVLQSSGQPCPAGTIGELYLSGPFLSSGYRQPRQTQTAFLGFDGIGGSRWYRTRDLVRQMEDGLQFCGRADSSLKIGGVWVDVTELQDRVRQVTGVRDVAVTAVPAHEAADRVSTIRVFVVPTLPLQPALWHRLRRALPLLAPVELVNFLPIKAATGKLDLQLLRAPTPSPTDAQRLAQRQQDLLERSCRWRCAAYRHLCRRDPLHGACLPFWWAGWMHAAKASQLVRKVSEVLQQFPFGRAAALLALRALDRRWLGCGALAAAVGLRQLQGSVVAWLPTFWAGVPLWLEREWGTWVPIFGDRPTWLADSATNDPLFDPETGPEDHGLSYGTRLLKRAAKRLLEDSAVAPAVVEVVLRHMTEIELLQWQECGWTAEVVQEWLNDARLGDATDALLRPVLGAALAAVGLPPEAQALALARVNWATLRRWQETGWDWGGVVADLGLDLAEDVLRPAVARLLCSLAVPPKAAEKVARAVAATPPHAWLGADLLHTLEGVEGLDPIADVVRPAVEAGLRRVGVAADTTAAIAAALSLPTLRQWLAARWDTAFLQQLSAQLGQGDLLDRVGRPVLAAVLRAVGLSDKPLRGDDQPLTLGRIARWKKKSQPGEAPSDRRRRCRTCSWPASRLLPTGTDGAYACPACVVAKSGAAPKWDPLWGEPHFRVDCTQRPNTRPQGPEASGPQWQRPSPPRPASPEGVDMTRSESQRVLQVVETITGLTALDMEATFLGLDSIKLVELAHCLHMVTGKSIGLPELMHSTLRQLLVRIQELAARSEGPSEGRANALVEVRQHRPWSWFWSVPCAWLLRLPPDADVPALRRAVARVLQRRPQLTSRPVAPFEHGSLVKEVAGLCTLWGSHRVPATCLRFLKRCVLGCLPAMETGCLAWDTTTSLSVVPCPSVAELRRLLHRNEKRFLPPFQATVFSLESDTGPIQYLQLLATHAAVDGYSVLPLVADLEALYREECQPAPAHHPSATPSPGPANGCVAAAAATDPPTPANGGDACVTDAPGAATASGDALSEDVWADVELPEQRLRHTLEDMAGRDSLFLAYALDRSVQFVCLHRTIGLLPSACALLQRVATKYNCPVEVGLLGVVA
eukprot:EG_transcript_483